MSERDEDDAEFDARFLAALSSEVPSLYFNGFIAKLTNGDITIAIERNGKPVGLLNMSYTVAKTLSISLSLAIARLEELSGRDMLTTTEIEKLVQQELDRGGDKA